LEKVNLQELDIMGWQATGILYGFFAWDYWGGVWHVGGACNLQCNGQSSFENQGSIPLQVTTIFNLGMCLKVCMYP